MSMYIQRLEAGGEGPSTYPALVLGWEMSRAGQSIVQDVIGGGVAITTLASRPRSGTLRLFYMYEESAVDAFNMHAPAGSFALSDLDEPGSWREMLYVVGDGGCRITLDEVTRRRWIVEVEYQELQPS